LKVILFFNYYMAFRSLLTRFKNVNFEPMKERAWLGLEIVVEVVIPTAVAIVACTAVATTGVLYENAKKTEIKMDRLEKRIEILESARK
jgi:hypothetical protein